MRKTLFVAVLLCFALSGFAQNKGNQPQAIIETSMGSIHCTLFPDKAPKSVANFVGLADGTKDWTDPVTHQKKHGVPLYDGTIFHRVIPGFMIQGGDPAGNGTGDPGYGFGLEVTSDLKFDRPGRLAYARTSDPNTNGSQFFITADKTPSLDGQYTIFGQCENLNVVQKIINGARDRNDHPYDPARITHIKIVK
jgi:peptidyl-prolyl cis-trans isomerase A (cyclophilin A)